MNIIKYITLSNIAFFKDILISKSHLDSAIILSYITFVLFAYNVSTYLNFPTTRGTFFIFCIGFLIFLVSLPTYYQLLNVELSRKRISYNFKYAGLLLFLINFTIFIVNLN